MSTVAPDILDNTGSDPRARAPLVLGRNNLASVTETVCRLAERPRATRGWYIAFTISCTLTAILLAMIGYLFWEGIGVWGVNIPVGWGFAITNFVWWIGIGHAGTLISAILFLFRQSWRNSINRFAEAMTIFAVMCAGLFPAIHVGRPWFIYWMFPYPNQMTIWPQFRSPLLWDVFAVSTYFTVSLLFWYTGMIPDLASLRDRAVTRARQIVYGIISLGWRGSQRHWHCYEWAYLILAGLATPLVLSVHSVVSFDFAVSMIPGWHSTIFPPYFVAGAIFSGLALVVTLIVPARRFFGLQDVVTMRHLDNLNKMILATGSMVAYSYVAEFFISWYSGNLFERFSSLNRILGPYWWCFWIMVLGNVIAPQLFWFRRCRQTTWIMLIISILVNIGMWFERFVIVVVSLHRDYVPTSWGMYAPTWVDLLTLAGSFGLFFTLFLLFCRYLPTVNITEVKGLMPEAHDNAEYGMMNAESGSDAPSVGNSSSIIPHSSLAFRGLLAEFANVSSLLAAARRVRDAGYTRWDVHSPFPVHGMDKAMRIRKTRLPWFAFACGVAGVGSALLLQWWCNAYDYPYLISGKPFFSIPANIPITFELGVLFAAIGTFVGLLVVNRLPELYNPVFTSDRFARVTTDGFFIVIEASDPKCDPQATAGLLRSAGATAVETLED